MREYAGIVSVAMIAALAGCSPGGDDPSITQPTTPPPASVSTETTPPSAGAADPWEHYIRDMVRCLTDKGWDIDDGGDGYGVHGGVPLAQVDQFDADKDACQARFGYDQLPGPSVSHDEAEDIYDLLLGVADCVRALGYDVPPPPSKQAFVEQLVAHPIPSWHPYDEVFQRGNPAEIQRVEAECPIP
jgi:hypothetical protein